MKRLISTTLLLTLISTATAQEVQLPVSGVIATANDGNVPANTLDGKLSTRWSAKGDDQSICYDLGCVRTVTSVQIAWYNGADRVAKFEIGTSPDASTWTSVFSGCSSGKTKNLETYNVTDSAARYVCIIGHGNNKDMWNSITEVKLFGLTATAPPPVVTNPPPPTASGPAGLLNLTNWKLTLPVDTSHPGKPDEILQPELSTFQDAYFSVNCTHNGAAMTHDPV